MPKIIVRIIKALTLSVGGRFCRVANKVRRSNRRPLLLDDDIEIQVCLPQPLGLGDLLMISPLIKMLEIKFPRQRILVVTEHAAFIRFARAVFVAKKDLNPVSKKFVIAPIFTFRNIFYIRKSLYYCGYFFSNILIANFQLSAGTITSRNHYFDGVFPILKSLEIEWGDDLSYPSVIKQPYATDTPDRYICVAPFSNWPARQYPYEYYRVLLEELVETLGLVVVLVGGDNPEETDCNRRLGELKGVTDLTGQLTLAQTSWIISRAELYIGNDSGPSHIAYVEAKNAYVIFGSVLPEERLPLNQTLRKKIKAVDSRASCSRYPCYDGISEPLCTHNLRCLRDLSPEVVYRDIVSEFFTGNIS